MREHIKLVGCHWTSQKIWSDALNEHFLLTPLAPVSETGTLLLTNLKSNDGSLIQKDTAFSLNSSNKVVLIIMHTPSRPTIFSIFHQMYIFLLVRHVLE